MIHDEIINLLITKFGYTSYLEIGTQNCTNYNKIICKNKVGVDPDPKRIFLGVVRATSDEFFSNNSMLFGIIFIDGDHNADQVYRDIVNSLGCLKHNGTIVCHDMNPENEEMQEVPRRVKIWTGDSWKAWVRLEMKGVEKFVIDTDFGVGIIRPKEGIKINYDQSMQELSYQDLEKSRKNLLNLISVQEFKDWLNVQ